MDIMFYTYAFGSDYESKNSHSYRGDHFGLRGMPAGGKITAVESLKNNRPPGLQTAAVIF